MRTLFSGIVIAMLLSAPALSAEPDARAEDREGIRRTALDYIEGWYAKDPARMERALHPQLIKRRVGIDAERKQSYLDEGSGLRLVQGTRPQPGRAVPPLGNQRRDVTILDLYSNAATVKIDADEWVDYLHVVKWNGEWKILNVLWELRPRS
jgi:hypothetical protein